jgi:hypothetical protein
MEATGYTGEGMIVIADDDELEWPQRVLRNVQQFANAAGFFVARMQSKLHLYHLDDAPNLKSCNMIFRAVPGEPKACRSEAIINTERLAHFYGKDNAPKVRYVRERKRLDYGMAHEDEYKMEFLEKRDAIDPQTR